MGILRGQMAVPDPQELEVKSVVNIWVLETKLGSSIIRALYIQVLFGPLLYEHYIHNC